MSALLPPTTSPETPAVGAGRRSGFVLAVVLVATFIINLDTTIVNVALPR